MAVYVTFLERGQRASSSAPSTNTGNSCNAGGWRYNRTDLEEIDRVVNRLINPLDPDLQQVITKINLKLRMRSGPSVPKPTSSLTRGDAKSISLSRNLIRRA